MPKTFGQSQKTLLLARILMERTDEEHKLTAEELSQILRDEYEGMDAERKSIYRYISALIDVGIDVEHDSEGYYIASREFEIAELKLLCDAVQSSRFITEKKSHELIEKLGTLASSYQASRLQRQIYVSGRIKSMNESIYYSVDSIHTALLESRRISFCYFDWNEKKEKIFRNGGERYTVEPLALCRDDENYYLIATDVSVGRIKHFRVDKMERISVEKEPVSISGDARGEMVGYRDRHFGMFGGEEELVVLRCKNELAGVILDRFGKSTPFHPSGDGHFTVSVHIAESVHFFTWLLNFGGGITVVSPEGVKNRFCGFVKESYKWVCDAEG